MITPYGAGAEGTADVQSAYGGYHRRAEESQLDEKEIKRLQELLGVTADGDFGASSYRALREFRRKVGLRADGPPSREDAERLSHRARDLPKVGSGKAGRVALVIGENAYANLRGLDNAGPDAYKMVELLSGHGFEVISCDGKELGCFDQNRAGLLNALTQLEIRAKGADLALVYYAGHGVATEEGNIVVPIDADVNCNTGAITKGVKVEQLMQATAPARHKFLILDACRNNPLRDICPGLKGKKLSFTRIEAGAMQGLLLVTSTQFGQQALDGFTGDHSPFANALFSALEAHPEVYFDQVMNEVAQGTYEAARRQQGFIQIPGRVVGGAAPSDCLAGKACVGDPRMVALAADNERLADDAAGTRNILASEEKDGSKPYTAEERKARVAQIEAMLVSIGKSADPLRQEGAWY